MASYYTRNEPFPVDFWDPSFLGIFIDERFKSFRIGESSQNYSFSKKIEDQTQTELDTSTHDSARFRASSAEVRGMFLNLSEVI